jgi:hypothetical protein
VAEQHLIGRRSTRGAGPRRGKSRTAPGEEQGRAGGAAPAGEQICAPSGRLLREQMDSTRLLET